MFPGDIPTSNNPPLLSDFFDCISGNQVIVMQKIPGGNAFSRSQYSWDARFTIGGGPSADAPPVNLPQVAGGPQLDWTLVLPWHNSWIDWYWSWFSQYFKYYAVQISVYRNYQEIPVSGDIWLISDPNYDANDPNRPIYSELVLPSSATPDPNITVDSYIRVQDDKSDWYRITNVSYDTTHSQWKLRLDRPYYYSSYNTSGQKYVFGIVPPAMSAQLPTRTHIVATNSLIESFTTILGNSTGS
jgi:hypothetical protein